MMSKTPAPGYPGAGVLAELQMMLGINVFTTYGEVGCDCVAEMQLACNYADHWLSLICLLMAMRSFSS